MNPKGNLHVIDAMVPLAEMFGYATALRSLSQGRANFHMEFSHYAEVSKLVRDSVLGGDEGDVVQTGS